MRGLLRLFALAGIPLGVIAYRTQVHELHTRHSWAAAIVAAAWSFLAAGLVAWRRRPENTLGPLMVSAGFALLARQLRYSHDPFLFTTFFALGELGYALVGHVALAYPSGRVRDRWERALVKLAYATALAFPLAILLCYDGTKQLRFLGPSPRRSLLLVWHDSSVAIALQKAFVVLFLGVLPACLIALIVRKFLRATPRGRQILAPLLVAAVALTLRAMWEGVFTFVNRPSAVVYDGLFWWEITAFAALPLVLLVGLLRARLARAGVGELVLELERTPANGLRDALARTLGDPTLEVAFWLPEQRGFVDAAGATVELPTNGHDRAVTPLDHEGEPLGVLLHDPLVLDEPELVAATCAAARLALQNARLQAETRAQLEQVRASRVRIVAAADEERRRIERDIHDGAQQRLVALALQLRSAQRRLGDADPEIELLLSASVDQLQLAVDELRELARGVHPAILTEEGLGAALESLAGRTPVPVSLDVLEERLPKQVEATAYFVACEALANVVKHANASHAAITAQRRNGTLVVEVEDDGVGGARAEQGSGLRGLADRVEALGGRFAFESPVGGGTSVVGEIPCVS